MKTPLFFAAVLLLAASNLFAQLKPHVFTLPPKDTSTFWIFKNVTAGPYFTGGVSRQNENLPEASSPLVWRSAPRFAYAFGGTIDFAISKWFGIDFSALYDSRDLYMADTSGSDNIDLNIGYLAFQPSIRIFWLLFGIAFDIPMSVGSTEVVGAYEHADQPIHTYTENLNGQTSDLQPLMEIRATLSVPVIAGDNAELYLIVSGNYPLSRAVRGTASFDTTGHFSGHFAPGQGPLPAVEAGICYQFDLLH